MRQASFFLISVAFHAAILAFPVSSFYETGGERVFPVIFLRGAGDDGQGSAGISRLETGREKASPGAGERHHAGMQRSGSEKVNATTKLEETTEAGNQVYLHAQDVAGEELVVARLSETTGVEEDRALFLGEVEEGGRREKSSGRANSEMEVSPGGQGDGGSSPELVFAQADYAHTPKPQYPERARREGWEGTVLLRVLVDQQGKSKWVEVSRSSGFEILDGAAMETVKGWRFHPARYGERRVKSWVNIPIIFRLADRDRGSLLVTR